MVERQGSQPGSGPVASAPLRSVHRPLAQGTRKLRHSEPVWDSVHRFLASGPCLDTSHPAPHRECTCTHLSMHTLPVKTHACPSPRVCTCTRRAHTCVPGHHWPLPSDLNTDEPGQIGRKGQPRRPPSPRQVLFSNPASVSLSGGRMGWVEGDLGAVRGQGIFMSLCTAGVSPGCCHPTGLLRSFPPLFLRFGARAGATHAVSDLP